MRFKSLSCPRKRASRGFSRLDSRFRGHDSERNLDSNELREKMVQAGRIRIEREWTVQKMTGNTESLFEELIQVKRTCQYIDSNANAKSGQENIRPFKAGDFY